MTLVDVFLYPFLALLVLCAVYRVLGWFMEDEPLPRGRLLVRQGNVTFFVDSEQEVAELAANYPGVTTVVRRER